MNKKIMVALLAMTLTFSVFAQSQISINIETPTKAIIKILPDNEPNTGKLDFSDAKGTLSIINNTTELISIEFLDASGNPIFKIPANMISKKKAAGDTAVTTTFSIDKDGVLSPAIPSGTLVKGIGFIVNSESKAGVARIEPLKGGISTDGNNDIETVTAENLRTYVEKQISAKGYTYVGGQNNLIVDEKSIVHIYMDENANPIYTYFPVAAKENYDKFQIHIISTHNYAYVIASTGEFTPTPISDEVETNMVKTQSDGIQQKIYEFKSAIFGPYSKTFPFTIRRSGSDGKNKLILDKTIKLLKTNRVSINTGVVSTWLRSPENVSIFVKPDGDTTLISDNPQVRGYLAIMLTFHFKPRNLNIQPRDPSERLGISVGTNLSSKAFDNFFLGLNVEITNGLFLNGGGHFGQVSHVVNYPDNFKYGKDIFSGTLVTRKKWNAGLYVAISVDAALFAKVFKNILSPAPNTGD